MRMDVDLGLRHLKCLQPEDSADEPFAWVFYFRLDGSTIRQNTSDPDRLIGSVVITTNVGSHGNLGVGTVNPGQHFQVPAAIGTHSTSLTPIRLTILGQQAAIPGRAGCFFVLLDEDSTTDAAIETAHQKLAGLIQQRLNEFVQNVSLADILSAAGQLRSERPELSLEDAAAEVLQRRLEDFADGLTDEAGGFVHDVVVEESNVFELIANGIDSDDLIGTFRFLPDERTLIGASLNMSFTGMVLFKPTDWKHAYDIGVGVAARLVPSSGDIREANELVSKSEAAGGEFVTTGQQLCIEPGTRIPWKLQHLQERYDFTFHYPFVDVVWSIDGVDLPPGREPGTLSLQKTVNLPRTDTPPKGIRVQTRQESRMVQVRYERTRERGVERLSVFNRPEDGQYRVDIGLTAVLPNGTRIPVDEASALFDGQDVELGQEFLDAYDRCIEQFQLPPRGKRVTLRDLWGPYGRERMLDRVTRQLEVVAEVRGLDDRRKASLAAAAARQLGRRQR